MLAVAYAVVGGASPVAAASDPLIEGAKQCTRLLPRYEKEYGIPKHLLSAIATTESGRYHDGLQLSIPWPWTINAEGKGYVYDSKREAVAAARKMIARGVQSMDIGCMQVNIYHHPDAFKSLDEAFDPQRNIAYAAKFLHTLYQESGHWKTAASAYHSKTPAKGSQYVGRVYNSWEKLVDKLRLAEQKIPDSTVTAMRDMRASRGVQYASLNTKQQTKKPVYKSPRMNKIELSRNTVAQQNGVLIVRRPEIQTAAVVPAIAADNIIRAGSAAYVPLRKGPNFIFSD